MNYKYPLFSKDDTILSNGFGGALLNRTCPICGGNFDNTGFAYFNAGAMHVKENGDSVVGKQKARLVSSWNIGYHYPEDCEYYGALVSMGIVSGFPNDGFVFYFCSIKCLRKWLDAVLDDVEEYLQNEHVRLASKFSETHENRNKIRRE